MSSSQSEARFGNGMTTAEVASSRDSYFANLQAANASKPADLPPSQGMGLQDETSEPQFHHTGGRYGGFGSSGTSHTMRQEVSYLQPLN